MLSVFYNPGDDLCFARWIAKFDETVLEIDAIENELDLIRLRCQRILVDSVHLQFYRDLGVITVKSIRGLTHDIPKGLRLLYIYMSGDGKVNSRSTAETHNF